MTAGVSVDKLVSIDGVHWIEVGQNVELPLQLVAGQTVYYQVVVHNDGTTALSGVGVTDTATGMSLNTTQLSGVNPTGYFSFGGQQYTTLAAGQSAVSDVVSEVVTDGSNSTVNFFTFNGGPHQRDQAVVTATANDSSGQHATPVSGYDTAGWTVVNPHLTVDSYRKTVAHLEGGVVAQILVREHDQVEAGQVLIRLDPTVAQAQLDLNSGNLIASEALVARLAAVRDGADEVIFPPSLTETRDTRAQAAMAAERRVFLGPARAARWPKPHPAAEKCSTR